MALIKSTRMREWNWEKTGKASVDQAMVNCVDSNHVAPDAPG